MPGNNRTILHTYIYTPLDNFATLLDINNVLKPPNAKRARKEVLTFLEHLASHLTYIKYSK